MDFLEMINLFMDFQDKTDARFYVEDGRIHCVIPTSQTNVELYEQAQAMFAPA